MFHRSSITRFAIVISVAAAFACSNKAADRQTVDSILIVNSGSSNRPGLQIAVDRSGHASITASSRRYIPQSGDAAPQERKVDEALVRRLYTELEAAKPLASLPRQHCMKSASFGTVLTVEWDGERTPDLNCGDGGDARLRDLIRTVKEIEAQCR